MFIDPLVRRSAAFVLAGLLPFTTPPAQAADAWRGGGPDGGWVTLLAQPLGPLGPTFAGTYGGGLFRSDDQGATWIAASSSVADAVVWDLALGEEGSVYLATEDRGMLRAQNVLADFWTPINAGLEDPFAPFVYGTEVHPGDPLRVSAATSYGLRTSRNRGGVWPDSLLVAPGEPLRDLLVMAERPNTVLAAAEEQLLVATGWIDPPVRIDAPDVVRDGVPQPNTLFDLERWPGSTDSVIVVDFEGAVLQLRDHTELVAIGPDVGDGVLPRLYRASVVAQGVTPVIRVGGDRGLYVSRDRGATWTLDTGGLPSVKPEIWSVLVQDAEQEDLLLGSFTRGVLHATGSTTWQERNAGLRAVWARGVDAHGGQLLVGTAHGRIVHGTDGETWTDVTGPLDDVQFAAVHLSRRSPSWFAAGFVGAYRTVDLGATWSALALPPGIDRIDCFVEPRWPGADTLFAITDEGVIVSADEGASWAMVDGLPSGRPSFAMATAAQAARVAVGFDPTPGTVETPSLWIGDGANEWREIALPSGFRGRVRGLAFLDPAGASLAVASTPGGNPVSPLVYRVDDLEPPQTPRFSSIAPGASGGFAFPVDLASDPARGVLYLALDVGGVLFSVDEGLQWTEWNEGLPTTRVEQLAVDLAPPVAGTGRVLLGTFARGAYVRDRAGEVAVAVDGPWIERADDTVRVRFSVEGARRARLVREIAANSVVIHEGDARTDVEVRESSAELLSLAHAVGARTVSWIVQVGGGGATATGDWSTAARVTRDVAELTRVLRTGLLPASPNPFNPRTSIRWEQARPGRVTLDLLDLRGRVVRRLLAAEVGEGRHALPWDGTDRRSSPVASGTYLVRLVVDGRSWSERITLIR